VLPHADHTEAQRVAERLRRAVADLVISGVEQQPRLTVSIGAAVAGTHGAALIDLLAAADVALYQAKAAGRDRVVFAPGVPTLSKPTESPQARRPAAET